MHLARAMYSRNQAQLNVPGLARARDERETRWQLGRVALVLWLEQIEEIGQQPASLGNDNMHGG
jgi:hypothetical protein